VTVGGNEQERRVYKPRLVGGKIMNASFHTYMLDIEPIDHISDEMREPSSPHEPRRGRDDIKAFMTDFRRAFQRSRVRAAMLAVRYLRDSI